MFRLTYLLTYAKKIVLCLWTEQLSAFVSLIISGTGACHLWCETVKVGSSLFLSTKHHVHRALLHMAQWHTKQL